MGKRSRVRMTGLDDLQKKLKTMQKGIEEFNGGKSVPFHDLFNEKFMDKYTKFKSIDDFFDKSPFKFKDAEEFAAINEIELDEYIKEHSSFSSWKEMRQVAANELIVNKMGL